MPAQMQFNKRFLSHKFCARGVKYEIGVCIASGEIVWLHGPARCGEHDISLARQAFVSFLNDGEMAIADKGYQGEPKHIKTPSIWSYRTEGEMATAHIAGMRHETVNRRFKHFQILTKPFRHCLMKQSSCFRAVAVVTQLNLTLGAPLFQVKYCDEGRH